MGYGNVVTTNPSPAIVGNTNVLLCTLDIRFHELLMTDAVIYSGFYTRTTSTVLRSLRDLLAAIDKGYDIVHLFSFVSPAGMITDDTGNAIDGVSLIQRCYNSGVKLLWIASDNKADTYIKHFKAPGIPINLVMTIDRRGSRFTSFLQALLFRLSQGEAMSGAWVALSPQSPRDPKHQDLPVTVLAVSQGALRFR
jgi:hypothetical protein